MTVGAPGYRHVYVHVPFCGRRCSYCDFSIAVRREVPTEEFVKTILVELWVRQVGAGFDDVETLYFGGGTPSKLGPAGVANLISRLTTEGLSLAKGAEVTIEANPEDITPAAAAAWLSAGVNRLSVGIQSFDDEALAWMHRTHSSDQASAGFRAAREAGFSDISLDLIYALPARLGRAWEADLERAIELEPDHLSVYGLTVEPRTPLGKWTARGAEVQQSDDRAAEEFLLADRLLKAAGYDHYEVSSYARPGMRSRHNSAYWRRVPYLGLGPSAHSFDGVARRWNISALAAWESAVAGGEDVAAGSETLTAEQHAAESLYLHLRTDTGAALRLPANTARAARWVSEGWATIDGARTRLTAEGWLRLDALVASLDPE